jgi:hypothetical protein
MIDFVRSYKNLMKRDGSTYPPPFQSACDDLLGTASEMDL